MIPLDDRASLLQQHSDLAEELASLHKFLGVVLGQEREMKESVFAQTPGSDRAREHAASLAAISFSKEVFKTRGEIDALTEQRDNIRTVLAYMQ